MISSVASLWCHLNQTQASTLLTPRSTSILSWEVMDFGIWSHLKTPSQCARTKRRKNTWWWEVTQFNMITYALFWCFRQDLEYELSVYLWSRSLHLPWLEKKVKYRFLQLIRGIMDPWAVSTFWLFWMPLLLAFVDRFLCGHVLGSLASTWDWNCWVMWRLCYLHCCYLFLYSICL